MKNKNEHHSVGEMAREKLVQAALDLFGRQGLDGVSIRQISDLAEMNVASISYHFGSKDGLYEAVADHLSEQILGGLLLNTENLFYNPIMSQANKLEKLLEIQQGIVTRDDAVAEDINPRLLSEWVAAGKLIRVQRGVYRSPDAPQRELSTPNVTSGTSVAIARMIMNLTWVKLRLWMLLQLGQLIVHSHENACDNIFGSHKNFFCVFHNSQFARSYDLFQLAPLVSSVVPNFFWRLRIPS